MARGATPLPLHRLRFVRLLEPDIGRFADIGGCETRILHRRPARPRRSRPVRIRRGTTCSEPESYSLDPAERRYVVPSGSLRHREARDPIRHTPHFEGSIVPHPSFGAEVHERQLLDAF